MSNGPDPWYTFDRRELIGIPETGCQLWHTHKSKYGSVRVGKRQVPAHRASYERHVGPIPPGLLIRHHCDTPACVNPDHLIPGTYSQNTNDARERGRLRKPQLFTLRDMSASRLTPGDAERIRKMLSAGSTPSMVARAFGVSKSLVRSINREMRDG